MQHASVPLGGRLARYAAALLCAAGIAGLLRVVEPAAVREGKNADNHSSVARLVDSAAGPQGVQIVSHGGYPELQVDGKPFFVNSAAFFYPRIPRRLWERSLEHYRDLGINTIELSIPWNWHELREGEYDFDGHTNPRRDLRGLLPLIAQYGFKLIARPGPTVLKEWRNGGYPDWLLERPEYRMPLVDRLEGRASPAAEWNADGPENSVRLWMENPAHLKYAREWMEAAARELAPYGSRKAQRVAGEEPAKGKTRVLYKDVSGPLLLVQVEEASTIAPEHSSGPAFWNYAEMLCGILAQGGVDAPCTVNLAQAEAATGGAARPHPVATMGQWFLIAESERGEGERRITPVEAAQLEFTAASLAMQPAFPPALIEYNAGWFAPHEDARPELSPAENTRVSSFLLLGYGLRGFNWFPLQDTLTPAGFGTPEANRYYRWDAALALNSARMARAAEVSRMGEWLRLWGSQLAAMHRRADFGLVNPLAALPRERLSRAETMANMHTLLQVQRVAQYAGFSAELADPEHQPVEQLLRHALLLLPVFQPDNPDSALTEKAQRALEGYVRGGGVLVCFPGRPAGAVFDGMEKERVADSKNLPVGTNGWKAGSGRWFVLTKDFYSWVELGADFAEGVKRLPARFALSLLEGLLAEAGMRPAVRRAAAGPRAGGLVATEIVSNEGTLPLGERSGGQGWLSVVNLSSDAVAAETLEVLSPRVSGRPRKPSSNDWVSLPVALPPRQALMLPLDLRLCLEPERDRGCEDAVVSSGVELLRAEREGKAMYLTFRAPARAALRLHLGARPEHVELDEVHADAPWNGPAHELNVEIPRGAAPQFLRVLRVPLPYHPALPERPKPDGGRRSPARFRLYPAGSVRLPLGYDATLVTNPPLFVFQRGNEGLMWMVAENQGGEPGDVHVRAEGQFNTSARGYAGGNELRSMNLKLPASAVEKAAAQAPAADGLYHGTLHFSSGNGSEDLPVAYAIVPVEGAIGYAFDFDADGSEERVLENSSVRAIFSPGEGGRMIALVEKSAETNLISTMGLLEDAFAFTPHRAGESREPAPGRWGTFNRTYSADWLPGDLGPSLHLSYNAPDVYPHGARIEKTARFAGDRRLTVEYRVALFPGDLQRLADEAAGKIFAGPLPPGDHPVPQSLEVLNSVPAEASDTRGTSFCWRNDEGGAEHCETFVAGGPAIRLPAEVTRLQIRQASQPGLALDWSRAPVGTRLGLEPQRYSMLLRLVFPPLDAGGAVATYGIEFTVTEPR